MTVPFRVRAYLHHILRVPMLQPANPLIGVTTTDDGGWTTRPLDTRQAAARLGMTPQALRRAAAAGRVIGATRDASGHWRYDPTLLELTGQDARRAYPSAASITVRGKRAA